MAYRSRKFRFGLRTYLAVFTGMAVLCAFIGFFYNELRVDQRQLDLLQSTGADVAFDYQEVTEGNLGGGSPKGAWVWRQLLGKAYFNRPIAVFMDRCDEPHQALRYAQYFQDLKYLSLKGPDAIDHTDDDVGLLLEFESLRVLTLSDTSVSGSTLVELATLKDLFAIHLDGTTVPDKDLEHLRQFPSLHAVMLDLSHVTKTGVSHLNSLQQTTLVIVQAPRATDSDVQRCVPILQTLDKDLDLRFRGSLITDASVGALSSLNRLKALNVMSTKLTPSAIRHLNDSPTLERVVSD